MIRTEINGIDTKKTREMMAETMLVLLKDRQNGQIFS